MNRKQQIIQEAINSVLFEEPSHWDKAVEAHTLAQDYDDDSPQYKTLMKQHHEHLANHYWETNPDRAHQALAASKLYS